MVQESKKASGPEFKSPQAHIFLNKRGIKKYISENGNSGVLLEKLAEELSLNSEIKMYRIKNKNLGNFWYNWEVPWVKLKVNSSRPISSRMNIGEINGLKANIFLL